MSSQIQVDRLSDGTLVASIVIASLVFGYNAAVTAIFAEPDFRYRQSPICKLF